MNTLNTSKIAQNTFSDGLIMDFNDLLVPASAYTNCLNGTCITYNGNEFVLQNDMGNGRVETAYLPAGYVPVGVKEYGGIIYIASVNPLTNECQLGSFPSPVEDGYGSDDIGPSDTLTISNDKLVHKQLALGPDNVLSVGDKFALELKGMSVEDAKKLISHCFNVNGTKIKTPKNKTFTLQLMVENSDHCLIDITSNLTRYDQSGNIITANQPYLSEQGYFLAFQESDNNSEQNNTDEQDNNNADESEITGSQAISPVDNLIITTEGTKYEQIYKGKVGGHLYIVCTINAVSKYQAQWIDLQNEKVEETGSNEQGAAGVRPESDSLEDDVHRLDKGELIVQKPLDEDPILPEDPQTSEATYSTEHTISLELKNNVPCVKIINTLKANDSDVTASYNFCGAVIDCTLEFYDTQNQLLSNGNLLNNNNVYRFSCGTTVRSEWLKLDTLLKETTSYIDENAHPVIYVSLLSQAAVVEMLQKSSKVKLTAIRIYSEYSNKNNTDTNTRVYYDTQNIDLTQSQDQTQYEISLPEIAKQTAFKTTLNYNLLYSMNQQLWAVRMQNDTDNPVYFYSKIDAYAGNVLKNTYNTKKSGRTIEDIQGNPSYIVDDTAYDDVFGLITDDVITKVTVKLKGMVRQKTLSEDIESIDVIIPVEYQDDGDNNADNNDVIEWTRENYDNFREPLPYKFVKKQEVFDPETLEEVTLQNSLFYDSNGININPSNIRLVVNTSRQFNAAEGQTIYVNIYSNSKLIQGVNINLIKYNNTYNNEDYYYLDLNNSALRRGTISLGVAVSQLLLPENKTGFILIPESDYSGFYKPTGTLLLNYYYNCPDGIYGTAEDGTNKYENIYGNTNDFGDPTLLGTRIHINVEGGNNEKIQDISLPTEKSLSTYDEQTNLYHLEQEVKCDFSELLNGSQGYSFDSLPNITYKAYPFLNFGLGEMENLVQQGTIEFKKVGTGDLQLSAWKYYWDATSDEITITWGLNNYLRTTQNIRNITFNFYRIYSGQTFETPDVTLTPEMKTYYTGTFTDEFSGQDQFVERAMYLVQIKCVITENGSSDSIIIGYRWFLASTAYNNAFHDNKIQDFASRDLHTLSIIDNVRTIKLNIDAVVTPGEVKKEDDITYERSGVSATPKALIEVGSSSMLDSFKNKTDVAVTVKETVTAQADIRCQLSWDLDGLPADDLRYNNIDGQYITPKWDFGNECTASYTISEPGIQSNINDKSVTLPYTITLENSKKYSGQKVSNIKQFGDGSINIPIYQLYKDYKKNEMFPGMLVYGYCHKDNKRDARVQIEVYRGDDASKNNGAGTTAFANSYLTHNACDTKSLVQYDPADLGEDNQNIIKDVVGTIADLTNKAEGYYINWGQGYASTNQTQIGYENQFIYMLRCDDGINNTPKYVAASTELYTKPKDYKCTTIWDTCYPELSNALIKLEARENTTAYYCNITNLPNIDSFQVTPKLSLGVNIEQLQFTVNGETDDYNTIVDNCQNSATNLVKIEEFDYIWGQMKLIYKPDDLQQTIVSLNPIQFMGSALIPSEAPTTAQLSKVITENNSNSADIKSFYTYDITDSDKVYQYENGIIKEASNIQQVNDGNNHVLRVKPKENKQFIPFLSIGADSLHKITNVRDYHDWSWVKFVIAPVFYDPSVSQTVNAALYATGITKFKISSLTTKYRFKDTSTGVQYIDQHPELDNEHRGGYPDSGIYFFDTAAGTMEVYKHKARLYIELGHIHT